MALTYEPIATTTLSSASASVTFSSISGSYTDIILAINASANTGSGYTLRFRVGNGSADSGSSYSWTQLTGDGASVASARNAASSPQNTYMYGGRITSTPEYGAQIAHFQNYSNTTTYKTALIRGGTTGVRLSATICLWRSTSAIDTIVVTNEEAVNFTAGSSFTIYGIKAA